MKTNKLLADVNLDIKIERGLKILQFGTQYNLRKAYFRHCPINVPPGQRDNNSNAKALHRHQHADLADILNQLNEEVKHWSEEGQKNKREDGLTKVGKIMPPTGLNKSISSSSHKSSPSRSDLPQQEQEEQPWDDGLDEISNYQSEAPKVQQKLKSIQQEPNEGNSVINMPIINKSQIGSKVSKSEIIKVEEGNDISINSKKSMRQKVEQVTIRSKQGSKFIKSDKVGEISVSNIHETSLKSISRYQKSIQTSRQQPKLKPTKKVNEQLSKISSKSSKSSISSNKSFLDKSISRIVSHSSQIPQGQEQGRSNISDFSLMRHLSTSFQDEENMRILLKLENCELEEGYLQRRIVNRLEKGYKEIGQILDISWESLKLPRMEHTFTRPNYAHLID